MPRRKRDRTDNWDNWDNTPIPPDIWDSPSSVPSRAFPWSAALIVLAVGLVVIVGIIALGRVFEGPVVAARRYALAAAAIDGNELASRTCHAKQLELVQSGIILTALSAVGEYYIGIGIDDITTDVNSLSFETVQEGSDEAEVHVSGEMRSALLFISIPIVIDEYWLMVREDGHWKWCGHSRPSAAPQLPDYMVPDS